MGLAPPNSGQRDALVATAVVTPLAVLGYMAAGSDGTLARAAKTGGILSLAGAFGAGILGLTTADRESKQLPNTLIGTLVGGVGGLLAGIAGSFAADALGNWR